MLIFRVYKIRNAQLMNPATDHCQASETPEAFLESRLQQETIHARSQYSGPRVQSLKLEVPFGLRILWD